MKTGAEKYGRWARIRKIIIIIPRQIHIKCRKLAIPQAYRAAQAFKFQICAATLACFFLTYYYSFSHGLVIILKCISIRTTITLVLHSHQGKPWMIQLLFRRSFPWLPPYQDRINFSRACDGFSLFLYVDVHFWFIKSFLVESDDLERNLR